jgi:rod shape-determining protein MreC
MQKILYFFRRYNFYLFFVFLQIIAISILVSYNNYQSAVFFNSFREFSGGVYKQYGSIRNYFSLKEINDSLNVENSRLRTTISAVYSRINNEKINYFDTSAQFQFVYRPCYVVYNTIHHQKNYFTINIGSDHGITKDMGVLTSSGVAGLIISVSHNYALVLSLLNTDFKLNAKIVEEGEIGSLEWDGKSPDHLILRYIPGHVELSKGQKVVVGPYSHFFPENYPVGTIDDFELLEGESFWTIRVRLHVKMRKIKAVYAVRKISLDEQLILEQELID